MLHERIVLVTLACTLSLACRASSYRALPVPVPVAVQVWDSGRTPLERMADVTNQLGLKVLYEHNFLNENNVAFSPYGLTGVLVALFEGVAGDSSFQIQRSLELPWNRDIMRIGFRDIHRTLKTYFIPEEGFLAGLALNNENVTFKDEYRNVLRFYGFDLEEDQLSKVPSHSNSTTTTLATNSNREETTPSSPAPNGTSPAEGPTATPKPTQDDITTVSPGSPSPAGASSVSADVELIGAPTQSDSPTASAATTGAPPSPTSETAPESPTALAATTDAQSSPTSETAPDSPIAPAAATDALPSPTSETAAESPTEPAAASDAPQPTAPETTPESPNAPATATDAPSSPPTAPETASESPNSPAATTDAPATSASQTEATAPPPPTTLKTLQRRKKSILEFIMARTPPYEEYVYESPVGYSAAAAAAAETAFGRTYSRENMFLANGLRNVEVTYMEYDTVLEYTYLPHFKASAVKLPLDNDNYYLLVVLPDYEFELNSLIKSLARESTLRDIYSSLQQRYVRACVPSFMVKGFVTLTTDLQRLGIRDVFEPRQNDFSPMTAQKGVYVRNVEQAITVTIRKYEQKTTQKSRYVLNRRPVHFSATYPFIYFVMDSNVHVALMAGKVMDPLNTRVL